MFDRFTDRARKVMALANQEAQRFNHDYVGTEHILLGLIREGTGVAASVLRNLEVNLKQLRMEVEKTVQSGPNKAVLDFLGGQFEAEEGEQGVPKKTKSKTPALDNFGKDLTADAKAGKLDPVIGRKKEIERIMQVLCRRTKKNPVLIGEAGVGKTAIVEGLAQAVVGNNVPELLRDKRMVILDLALMVAGTKYRGQFEERIKAVMNEVRRAKNIVLFIDELHTLVGAGGAEGAIDASNVLKPALSRGEIQCIGATTLNEYRKYIEKDAALERRFQIIMVDPSTRQETLDILKGLRDRYEAHHKVHITDAALEAAVELSDRYIAGRFLPDKAIDVMDEASSRVRLRMMTKPPDLRELEERIEQLNNEKRVGVAREEFEQAAELKHQIDELMQEKDEILKAWRQETQEALGTVDEEVIAGVVSGMTGVPLTRLESKEAERLLNMEAELHRMVVSQDEAINAIAKAVRRSRSGLKDPHRPMGSFVFLGPSGVGKTLLARALAKFMFGEEEALLQIDMSEYMEKFNVSRLIGAPPGYVGYEEGGQLTERIRRRPYSVVLMDEIEKAHPDVFNMLLQIMEEGRLTDSFGRQVDFRNTVLIMTSNIGVELTRSQASLGFRRGRETQDYGQMREKLLVEVDRHFRPEFLNRLDGVIVFRSLSPENLKQIIDIEIARVRERLRDRGLDLVLTDDARELLIKEGYTPEQGARPLKRAIERLIEDPISEEILKGEFEGKDRLTVRVQDEHMVFDASVEKEEVPAASDC